MTWYSRAGLKYVDERIKTVKEQIASNLDVSGLTGSLVEQQKLDRDEINASLLDLMGASVDTVCDYGRLQYMCIYVYVQYI